MSSKKKRDRAEKAKKHAAYLKTKKMTTKERKVELTKRIKKKKK